MNFLFSIVYISKIKYIIYHRSSTWKCKKKPKPNYHPLSNSLLQNSKQHEVSVADVNFPTSMFSPSYYVRSWLGRTQGTLTSLSHPFQQPERKGEVCIINLMESWEPAGADWNFFLSTFASRLARLPSAFLLRVEVLTPPLVLWYWDGTWGKSWRLVGEIWFSLFWPNWVKCVRECAD